MSKQKRRVQQASRAARISQRRSDHIIGSLIEAAASRGVDLACGYGCHDWVFNEPHPGFKRCAGSCGGVYHMLPWEIELKPTAEGRAA